MTDLSLICVNNTIVGLRKPIAKAEVHIIHKLTRQAKSLREKKTPDSEAGKRQKLQNERKADRLVKEIYALKKAKKRDIALFVLQNTDSWLPELPRHLVSNDNVQSVSNDTDKNKELIDSLSKRALIRMSNHGVVKKLVTQFRQDYPRWNEDLPGLLAVLGNKQRLKDELSKSNRRKEERKRRKQKNKDKKSQNDESVSDKKLQVTNDKKPKEESDLDSAGEDSKSHDDNEMEINIQDSDASNEGESEASYDEESEADNDEESETDNDESETSVNQEFDVNNESSTEVINVASNMNISRNSNNDKKERSVQKQMNKSAKFVEKQEGDMVIKRLNVKQDNTELFPEKFQNYNENHDTKNQSKAVKDSFFLGGVSDSAADSESDHEENQNNILQSTKSKRMNFTQGEKINKSNENRNYDSRIPRQSMNRRDRRESDRRRNGKNEFGRNFKLKDKNKNVPSHDTKKSFPFNRKMNNYEGNKNQSNTKTIHPSWAAKRKMADSAHININAKMNKITFDDNGETASKSFPKTNSQHTKHIDKGLKNENIHPSWAAKKDQKGIQQFSGKKTVFGDDD